MLYQSHRAGEDRGWGGVTVQYRNRKIFKDLLDAWIKLHVEVTVYNKQG